MQTRRRLAVAIAILAVLPVVGAAAPAEDRVAEALEGGFLLVERLVKGERRDVSLTLSDVPGLAFRANLTGALLVFEVDGRWVETFAGPTQYDVGLTPGNHTLSWTAYGSSDDASVELESLGAVMVRPPDVIARPGFLTTCTLRPFLVELHSSLPLVDAMVTVDGESARAEITSEQDDLSTTTRLLIHASQPDGASWRRVEVTVMDVVGISWRLPAFTFYHEVAPQLGAGPSGWVYDQQPDITLLSACAASEVLGVTATLDGSPVELRGGAHAWSIPPTHVWRYEESHDYEFHVLMADGTTHHLHGRTIEGLDEMAIELPRSATLVAASSSGTATFAASTLAAAAAGTGLPDSRHVLDLPEDAHLSAVYAPHALRCLATNVCLAYGGDAPGYGPAAALRAELVISTEDGMTRIPGFGQLAAAAARNAPPFGLPETP